MSANFTPDMTGYKGLSPFRFWCQKTLPLVYDDSLSYYELLCKVVSYINNLITDVAAAEENVDKLLTAYNQLQEYVNNYFDGEDFQQKIDDSLDRYAEDGTLSRMVNTHVTALLPYEVGQQIGAVVDEDLGPVVDLKLPAVVESKIAAPVATQLPGVVQNQIDAVVGNQIDGAVAGQIDEVVADQITDAVSPLVHDEVTGLIRPAVSAELPAALQVYLPPEVQTQLPGAIGTDLETIAPPVIEDWLDAHPEATTSVPDGSISFSKLATDLQRRAGIVGTYFPADFTNEYAWQVNQYAVYQGIVYRCIKTTTAGQAWNASEWTTANMNSDLFYMWWCLNYLSQSITTIDSSPATSAHEAGEYFIYYDGAHLYRLAKASSNIAVGDTLTVNGNFIYSSVANMIADLKVEIADLKSALTANTRDTSNLLTGKKSVVINGVTVTYENGNLSIRGTANSSGGRTNKISDLISLSAGEYFVYVSGDMETVPLYIEDSENNILITLTGQTPYKRMALNTATDVYIGINTQNETTYNIDLKVGILKGNRLSTVINSRSAYDSVTESYAIKNESEITEITEDTLNLIKGQEFIYKAFGVVIEAKKNNFIKITGTANESGGGTLGVAYATLPAGTYRVYTFPMGSVTVAIRKASDDTYLGSGEIVLLETTEIYVAVPITTGQLYDKSFYIALYNAAENVPYGKYIPSLTAVDYKARDKIFGNVLYDNAIPLTTKIKNGATWSQSACVIDNKSVGFDASDDSHTNTSTYKVSPVFDVDNVQTGSHNLGHCVSCDYCEKTDYIMVATGPNAPSNQPSLFLIDNAKEKTENLALLNYADELRIDLTGLTDTWMGACFGESECFIYILVNNTAGTYGNKKFIKALLGMGSHNMLTDYSENSYGIFLSGKADNEYNGTIHLLNEYVCDLYSMGEIQGIKWCNGKIIMPTNFVVNGTLTSFISVIKLDNDTAQIVGNYSVPHYDNEGNRIGSESEDVIIYEGYGIVANNVNGNAKTIRFPLALF